MGLRGANVTHTGARGPGPRTTLGHVSRQTVGGCLGRKGCERERRGPQHTHTVWDRADEWTRGLAVIASHRGPTRHSDKCCGQRVWGKALHEKESELTFYRAAMTTAHTLKNNTKVGPSYLIKWGGGCRRWAPARSVHRCSVFSKHTERRGGEDYSYPHDDGLKNRPFIHHQSTITQCTHHFHAVILMVSSTWLHGVHVHRHLSKCSILLICVINRLCTTSSIHSFLFPLSFYIVMRILLLPCPLTTELLIVRLAEFLWYGMMNCLLCLVYHCLVRLAECFDFDSRFCCFGGTPLPDWGRRGSVSSFKQQSAEKVFQKPTKPSLSFQIWHG